MQAIVPLDEGSYSYAGTGCANPDAVTQIANGLSTTTYSYDQNGNLRPKDHRRRNHNICLGLCKSSHCAGFWRRDHHVRLRCLRQPRFPSNCHEHDPLSVQVVLRRVIHGAAVPHTQRPRSMCLMVIPLSPPLTSNSRAA